MNLKKDYILENEAVLLRPLVATDIDFLLEYALNEPEIWQFNARGANSAEHLKEYIATAIENRNKEIDYPFIVYSKTAQKYVGSTRFYNIHLFNQTLEIGFTWYGKQYQGTALNKHCKLLLLTFAFEDLKMERVGFRANNLNKRSISAMKSIGCKEEGVLRNFSTDAAGNRIDSIVLSILKDEWFTGVKTNLQKKIAQQIHL